MKRILAITGLICLSSIFVMAQRADYEFVTVKRLVEEKDYGIFCIKAAFDDVHDYGKLVFIVEDDNYIIPIQLKKDDLGAEKRFRALNLQKGDSLFIKGSLHRIYIDKENYKGLTDAAIIDKNDIAKANAPTQAESPGEAIPFELVEVKPSFNGGDANEFLKWVNSRLVYPEIAKKNGIQGRVTLQYTIDSNGCVQNVKVIRGLEPSLDAEAVRVVSSSPKWTPGTSNGLPVSVTYTFPVIFQLR